MLFLVIFSFFPAAAYALHLTVTSRSPGLLRRRPSGLYLENIDNVSYTAELALGNQTFQVLIDTGSADLWVAGKVANSVESGTTGHLNYANRVITGPVKFADLKFAGHNVSRQAFIEVAPDSYHKAGSGILGLGPSTSSLVAKQVNQGMAGMPVLERIFVQNRSAPNFFTLLLGRAADPTDFYSGSITVGEVLESHAAILGEPKLVITKVPAQDSEDQHVQTLLDADGLIGPDGQAIPLLSSVRRNAADRKRMTVVLDCGFTLPQMDADVTAAIYSRFEGAELQTIPGIKRVWTLPCVQEVNITFKFSGKEYPVHPLDMTIEPEKIDVPAWNNAKGEKMCIGTFQPFTYDRGLNPNYDMVLGMAFMRNVYALFDYGDFVEESSDLKEPYIQMLSTTDREEAHRDFVEIRLGGVDTTANRMIKEAKKSSARKTMYYIVAAVCVVAVLLALVLLIVCRRRRRLR